MKPALIVASPPHADLARRAADQGQVAATVHVIDGDGGDRRVGRSGRARSPATSRCCCSRRGRRARRSRRCSRTDRCSPTSSRCRRTRACRSSPSDVALGVLPMFHVFGLNVVLGLALHAGASVSLVDHFHPGETLDRVRADGVTVVAAVPSIYAAWLALDEQRAPADSFARVRLCVSGATALPGDVVDAMRARFGTRRPRRVRADRGVARRHDHCRRARTPRAIRSARRSRASRCGWSTPTGTRCSRAIRARSSCAAPTSSRATGTIPTPRPPSSPAAGCTPATSRSPTPTAGSRSSIAPRTSSSCRASTCIRARSRKRCATHRDVEDVAVIGEPHPRTRRDRRRVRRAARRVARPDPVELLRHAARSLARYKLPTRVEVVDALPRTLAGKVVRRALGGAARTARPTRPRSPRRSPRSRPRAR